MVKTYLSNDDFYILSTLRFKVKVFIQINLNFRFDGEKVLLLVESPQDALRLILSGIEVSRINIGSLSFDNSKKMISDTVAVSQRDIQVFQLLHQHEIQLEIRKVSSDNPKDLWQILIDKHLITE
uniref:PTS sugar transporter subunit IIB n=1 Tax=Ligilactobacillus aviarius TaxID=1606 RepID=UPI0009C03671|nr:PTS sugar transporter subunit IIB [Ligilactobacillus aviarius]